MRSFVLNIGFNESYEVLTKSLFFLKMTRENLKDEKLQKIITVSTIRLTFLLYVFFFNFRF